ncbi:MAG TPA: methyltransferase [Vicinamibacteria bacterium]|nr:methyltransferase [Vicinamibacteria bacterium]
MGERAHDPVGGLGQYEAWGGLLGSIQTGEAAFDQVFGCNAWEWYPRHPEVFSAFNETMRSLSATITPAVTAAYDWSRFAVIADIGGGIGTQLADISERAPDLPGNLVGSAWCGSRRDCSRPDESNGRRLLQERARGRRCVHPSVDTS